MTDLITRLEEAAEGSRELDLLVWASYGFLGTLGEKMGHVTTSIDAALALAERVLAVTCRSGLQENPDRTWSAAILRVYPDDREGPVADAATPALAICIAILRANHKDKP